VALGGPETIGVEAVMQRPVRRQAGLMPGGQGYRQLSENQGCLWPSPGCMQHGSPVDVHVPVSRWILAVPSLMDSVSAISLVRGPLAARR
jgi:hypothetical protein